MQELIISNLILCNGKFNRQLSDDRKSWDYWAMFTQAYAEGKIGALSVERSADRVIPAIFATRGLEKKKLTSEIVDEAKLQESDFHEAVRVKVAAQSDSATKIGAKNKLQEEAKSRRLKKVLFGNNPLKIRFMNKLCPED